MSIENRFDPLAQTDIPLGPQANQPSDLLPSGSNLVNPALVDQDELAVTEAAVSYVELPHINDDGETDAQKAQKLGAIGGAVAGIAAGSAAGTLGAVVGGVVGAVAASAVSGAVVGAIDKHDGDDEPMEANNEPLMPIDEEKVRRFDGRNNEDTFRDWRRRVEKLDLDYNEQVSSHPGDAMLNQAWEDYKRQSISIRRELEHVRDRMPDAWDEMKDGIQKAVEELETGYRRTIDTLQSRKAS